MKKCQCEKCQLLETISRELDIGQHYVNQGDFSTEYSGTLYEDNLILYHRLVEETKDHQK